MKFTIILGLFLMAVSYCLVSIGNKTFNAFNWHESGSWGLGFLFVFSMIVSAVIGDARKR